MQDSLRIELPQVNFDFAANIRVTRPTICEGSKKTKRTEGREIRETSHRCLQGYPSEGGTEPEAGNRELLRIAGDFLTL
jgi:hypothetical protein